jgi:hypothetical protein
MRRQLDANDIAFGPIAENVEWLFRFSRRVLCLILYVSALLDVDWIANDALCNQKADRELQIVTWRAHGNGDGFYFAISQRSVRDLNFERLLDGQLVRGRGGGESPHSLHGCLNDRAAHWLLPTSARRRVVRAEGIEPSWPCGPLAIQVTRTAGAQRGRLDSYCFSERGLLALLKLNSPYF